MLTIEDHLSIKNPQLIFLKESFSQIYPELTLLVQDDCSFLDFSKTPDNVSYERLSTELSSLFYYCDRVMLKTIRKCFGEVAHDIHFV